MQTLTPMAMTFIWFHAGYKPSYDRADNTILSAAFSEVIPRGKQMVLMR